MAGLTASSVLLLNVSLFLLLFACNGANAGSGSSGSLFDITAFGAVADGKKDAAAALVAAWGKACALQGTPTVLIPEGTFLVGPVTLRGPCKSPIVVQVKGVVRAPVDIGAFPDEFWVTFEGIHGLTVTGGGVFDGQGAAAWKRGYCTDCKKLPTSVRLYSVSSATVQGISSINSKWFHMWAAESNHVTFRNITITAPGNSPNTDGIHVSNSTDVAISDSVIGTGDDCISIGTGTTNIGVSNVICGPGHGISVGSLGEFPTDRDVSHLVVSNCTLKNTKNGARIRSWPSSYAMSASDITFENMVMQNVSNPIIIDQEYCPHDTCGDTFPSRVRISDVNFRSIRGTSASKAAIQLVCSKDFPCQNVDLKDIDLVSNQKGVETISLCANVKGSTSEGYMNPKSCI